MSTSGKFLVLEGIDGSGTTTQAEKLKTHYESLGQEVQLTREPTTGPIGRFLRQALTGELLDAEGKATALEWDSMALLFAADRLDHLRIEIEPALQRGALVVCDRYDLSSLIYQSATSPVGSLCLPWLGSLNQRARRPDLTIVLDVPAVLAEARRKGRAEKEEIYEKSELQKRLSTMYARPADFLPQDRFEVISTSGSIDEVAATIHQRINLHL